MKKYVLFCASSILATAMLGTAASASDEPDSAAASQGNEQRCISVRRIDNTDVIDDQTIVFYMLGSDIYLNKLPHRCPTLRSQKTISYKVQTSQLCSVDTITVLDSIGGGINRGPTCGLGMFTPITREELKLLKNPEDAEEEPGPEEEKEA